MHAVMCQVKHNDLLPTPSPMAPPSLLGSLAASLLTYPPPSLPPSLPPPPRTPAPHTHTHTHPPTHLASGGERQGAAQPQHHIAFQRVVLAQHTPVAEDQIACSSSGAKWCAAWCGVVQGCGVVGGGRDAEAVGTAA